MGAYRLVGEGARVIRSYIPEADDALLRTWRAGQSFPVED
jgi:hypothetical protein